MNSVNTKDRQHLEIGSLQKIDEVSDSDENNSEQTYNFKINWKMFFLINALFLLLGGLIIGTDFAYKDSLFNKDVETVPDIQHKHSFMDYFMQVIAISGEAPGIMFITLIAVSILPYIDGLFFTLVVCVTSYTNEILKMLHHDPRPQHVDGDIEALTCSKSYGNPSGHGMTYTVVYPMLFYLLFYSKHFNHGDKTSKYWSAYIIVGILLIAIAILGVFGRIYLGVHSYDQVIYGLFFGTVMFWHIFIVYKNIYDSLICRYITRNCSKRECIVGSFISCAIVGGLLCIALIAYTINTTTHDDPASWSANIMIKGNLTSLHKNSLFARQSLRSLFLTSGTVTGLLATILYSYFVKQVTNHQSFDRWWNVYARIGINFMIPIPIILLSLLSSSAPLTILLIFAEFTVGVGLGFITFSVSKYANKGINKY